MTSSMSPNARLQAAYERGMRQAAEAWSEIKRERAHRSEGIPVSTVPGQVMASKIAKEAERRGVSIEELVADDPSLLSRYEREREAGVVFPPTVEKTAGQRLADGIIKEVEAIEKAEAIDFESALRRWSSDPRNVRRAEVAQLA